MNATTNNLETEIHNTILELCKTIQEKAKAEYYFDQLPQLVEATAKLIESTKDRGIF